MVIHAAVLVVASMVAAEPTEEQEKTEATEAHKKLDEAMGWLIGDWERESTLRGRKYTFTLSAKWIFDEQYIEITDSVKADGKPVTSGRVTCVWDSCQNRLFRWGIGHGMSGYSTGIGEATAGPGVVFEITNVRAGGKTDKRKRWFTRIEKRHKTDGNSQTAHRLFR